MKMYMYAGAVLVLVLGLQQVSAEEQECGTDSCTASITDRLSQLENRTAKINLPCNWQVTAFSAYMTSLTSVSAGDTMKFDGIISNTGSHYHPASGNFTCPCSGHYVFSLNLMSERYQNQAYGRIVKDGEVIAYALASSTNRAGHYSHAAAFVIIECLFGERVWVEGYQLTSKVYGNRFSTFSGHLLIGF